MTVAMMMMSVGRRRSRRSSFLLDIATLHERLLMTKHLLFGRCVDHDGRFGTLLMVRREESLRETRWGRSTLLGRLRYKRRSEGRVAVVVKPLVTFLLQRFKLDQLW